MLGSAALVTFLISAVPCGLLVLCFAEMGSRFRTTGGPMIYAEAAFGRTTGFAIGWVFWLKSVTSWGALLNGLYTAAGTLIAVVHDHRVLFLVAAMVALAGANVAGVALGARISNFFTVAKLLPIVALIGAGLFRLHGDLFVPFAPHGFANVGPATMVILYAFVGFGSLTIPTGEMRDPARSVPRALLVVMGTRDADLRLAGGGVRAGASHGGARRRGGGPRDPRSVPATGHAGGRCGALAAHRRDLRAGMEPLVSIRRTVCESGHPPTGRRQLERNPDRPAREVMRVR
jgi:amino acid transporter